MQKFPHYQTFNEGKQELTIYFDLEGDFKIEIKQGDYKLDVTKLFEKLPSDLAYNFYEKVSSDVEEMQPHIDDSDFFGNREIDLL